jgi:RNA polymerase sigma-70 factor, ECF subfamily
MPAGEGAGLLELYDRALPQVYGYLMARCADRALAEDLTAETFLAAASSRQEPISVGWLIGVARHKLADHWRGEARRQRLLEAVGEAAPENDDPWPATLDKLRAREVLAGLAPHHRAVLVLRYVDGLSVPETAVTLDRTVHATEALLVRARRAFRRRYAGNGLGPEDRKEGEDV